MLANGVRPTEFIVKIRMHCSVFYVLLLHNKWTDIAFTAKIMPRRHLSENKLCKPLVISTCHFVKIHTSMNVLNTPTVVSQSSLDNFRVVSCTRHKYLNFHDFFFSWFINLYATFVFFTEIKLIFKFTEWNTLSFIC